MGGPLLCARTYVALGLICCALTLDDWAQSLVHAADRLTDWSTALDALEGAETYSTARDLIDTADRSPLEVAA